MTAEAESRLLEIRLLRRRVSALEKLLACYRAGTRPAERTFSELEATRAVKDGAPL